MLRRLITRTAGTGVNTIALKPRVSKAWLSHVTPAVRITPRQLTPIEDRLFNCSLMSRLRMRAFTNAPRSLCKPIEPIAPPPIPRISAAAKQPETKQQNNCSNFKDRLKGVLAASYAVGALAFLYNSNIRERKIIQKTIKQNELNQVRNVADLVRIGDKPKGQLSGYLVQDPPTGKIYLLKGAQSFHTFMLEYVISNFLAELDPGRQPESLLAQQQILNSNESRFYTLSRVYPNSMDLESFLVQADWREKLKAKPLTGLEWSLAADLLFSKGQDMKFANYIIIEESNCFVIRTIDHEMAERSIYGGNKAMFSLEPNEFLQFIWETRNISFDEKHSSPPGLQLADTPVAYEFMSIAKSNMKPANIEKFYQQVAAMNPKPLLDKLDSLKTSGLLTEKQCDYYKDLIATKIAETKKFLHPSLTPQL